jgi:acyl-CoA dehydrogenase
MDCSEALGRVVDRSLQVLGGMGITDDTVVERIYRDTRAFGIYDGPSEVHRFAIAHRRRRRPPLAITFVHTYHGQQRGG